MRSTTLMMTNNNYAYLVDSEDVERIKNFQYSWYGYKSGNHDYIKANIPKEDGEGYTSLCLHHFIVGHPPDGYDTHHVNGNGLDNRKSNLEHITRSEHLLKTKRINKSGFRGVYPTESGRFHAKIKYEGENIYLGTYDRPETAHLVYMNKRLELRGM